MRVPTFTLTTSNGAVWVAPNATEHLAEYAAANLARGVTPDLVNMATQVQLTSLRAAVTEVLSGGSISYGTAYRVGGWELAFGAPGQTGSLPALIHALNLF